MSSDWAKTGGPAYPNITPDMNVDGGPGMDLRDWFAGQALAQIIADGFVDYEHPGWEQRISSSAYTIADAMIAERLKP